MNQLVEILVNVLIFAFIAGIFVLVFMLSRHGRKKNKQINEGYSRLARIAPENGWSYTPHVYGRIDQYCGSRPMPGSGSNLGAFHYTNGEFRGRSFVFFEHRQVDGSATSQPGDAKSLIVDSVFVVTTPGIAPTVDILLPSKLDVVLDRRARTELGVPEFDEKFRVVTDDEEFVRNVLGDTIVPLLLTDSRASSSPLQFRKNELCTWYRGTLSPEVADEKLNFLCDALDQVPAQAWSAA
ncbi:hypothetical protein ACVHNB_08985 [Streptomyces sp. YJ-C3]